MEKNDHVSNGMCKLIFIQEQKEKMNKKMIKLMILILCCVTINYSIKYLFNSFIN